MTLEQVNAAIAKHLDPDNLRIVMVTGEAEAMREALIADAPATIEYPTPKPDAVLREDERIGAHKLGIAADAVEVIGVDEMFAN